MKTDVTLIQARSSSTRLPDKVSKIILGETLIERIYKISNMSKNSSESVVLTSESNSDENFCSLMDKLSINYFRADLDNVFIRYKKYLIKNKLTNGFFVRLTADCPLLDYGIIDQTIDEHIANNNDYTTTDHGGSFPLGQSVEVVNIDKFLSIDENQLDSLDKEHVTRYIWKRPELFKCGKITYVNKTDLNTKNVRLTIDEEEDFTLVESIIENLKYTDDKFPNLYDILNFLNKNMKLLEINMHVEQVSVD